MVIALLVIAVCALLVLLARGRSTELHDALIRFETRQIDQLALVNALEQQLADGQLRQAEQQLNIKEDMRRLAAAQLQQLLQSQRGGHNDVRQALHQGIAHTQQQVMDALTRHARTINEEVGKLTQTTDRRLTEIAGEVDRRLNEGFEKTSATFTDIVRRLALIDEAQKRITDLSSNVVSLQEILADKRARGAFGEVQLASLVRNVLPESHFSLQHHLGNGRIADCMLLLPPPTGHLVIDAKFPLEAYRQMTDYAAGDSDRKAATARFRQDVRKHITDIAARYIVPAETADAAMMFIPAEAVFAEIQAHHPELVELAHRSRVWLVSPTTMWAILNTARSVLKDAAFREQVDVIREHLGLLGQDFERFRGRLDALSRHIEQAHHDVQGVHRSAKKLSDRFGRLERAELPLNENAHEDSENSGNSADL
ncbi:MAG: DNA recombination protein RmuC [Gammaproteobacteria bacterium]|nr:DNA recombination protein RmuC [Gammaproteobacteria bacterium]